MLHNNMSFGDRAGELGDALCWIARDRPSEDGTVYVRGRGRPTGYTLRRYLIRFDRSESNFFNLQVAH